MRAIQRTRSASSAMPMCEKAQWSVTAVQGIGDTLTLQSYTSHLIGIGQAYSSFHTALCLCPQTTVSSTG